ncbi:MAG: F0F1 ATP synthase subunit B [Eubacteriales bacterium]|nr:F0F1 ATP synthase subunit B [Eubacteriales bacterium]
MLKFDWNMLWTLINLIIFFVLMKVFLFKPIKKTLDKRKELIDNQFKEADDAKAEAENLKTQYEQQLDGVEDERAQIIAKAREDAKAEYDKTIDRARDDAQKIKDEAAKAAKLQTEKAKRAVKEEIAQVAIQAAEKVVGREVSAQTDSDIFDEFLNESSDK